MAKAPAKKVEPRSVEVLDVRDGDQCEVVAGAHTGKSGRVEDRKVSKTGHVTITVRLADVQNGDQCDVIAGAHKGKSGRVEDRNVSKTGHVTITVRLADDDRVKTLARNVVVTKMGRR